MRVASGEVVAAVVVGLWFLVRLGIALSQARSDARIAARHETTAR